MSEAKGGPAAGRYYLYGLAVIAVAALAVLFFLNQRGGDVVASVNGVAITEEQLLDRIPLSTRQSVLDSLIFDELIQQEAKAQAVSVSDAEIDRRLEELKADFGDPVAFEQTLAMQGLDIDQLRRQLRLDLLVRKLLEPSIEMKDADLEAYFEENRVAYDQPEEVRASHILVETREEAEEIRSQLLNGADFAELAKEHSLDPGSKDRGGDLDWFGRGRMNQPFEEAAFSLPVGEISEPVESPNGFHIIRVTDKREAKPAVYEAVKEQVREDYLMAKMQELAPDWIQGLREKAAIENRLAPSAT